MKNMPPTKETGLEDMGNRALLKILEECDGSESPIIVEILRRLLKEKVDGA